VISLENLGFGLSIWDCKCSGAENHLHRLTPSLSGHDLIALCTATCPESASILNLSVASVMDQSKNISCTSKSWVQHLVSRSICQLRHLTCQYSINWSHSHYIKSSIISKPPSSLIKCIQSLVPSNLAPAHPV
jgi:hypothetical protein